MQKITPMFWFDTQAEEAADFYTSVFKKSKITSVMKYDKAAASASGMPDGSVLTVGFEIEGVPFTALNGGPIFKPNPSISFTVACPTAEEVDELWNSLSEGGEALMPIDSYPWSARYGWVKDKYGITWQLIARDGAKREIIPSLMYVGPVAGRAREAMNLYASIFKDSRIGDIMEYGPEQPGEKPGTIAHGEFILAGQKFIAMDSAQDHKFNFTEAISLVIDCKDQNETDYYWEKLTAGGGEESQCGWLKDKFGISWQVVPREIFAYINNKDPEKAGRAMAAMLEMRKLDIATLKKACEGK